jgi:hypothetical protein
MLRYPAVCYVGTIAPEEHIVSHLQGKYHVPVVATIIPEDSVLPSSAQKSLLEICYQRVRGNTAQFLR